ncbi:glycoside hydrolase family 104 protein [Robbsia sp. KACC 23696]|uniref:glycoside hydrolase family 24 protein n=1 Tax=Robbsia sp. KACC 23696 TaxID=3149231 RepID=UPI00325AF1EA
MTANRRAFLQMLRYSEGTATTPGTKYQGYDVVVRGIVVDDQRRPVLDSKGNARLAPIELMTDFSTHPFANGRPSKIINAHGLLSTASGGLQIKLSNWRYYGPLVGAKDFGPDNQDAIALYMINERGALGLIDAGRFDDAVARVANLWASLPSAGYGQLEHPIDTVRSYYLAAGGTVSAS